MWNDDTNEGGFNVSGYGSSPSVASQDTKQSRKPNSLFPVAIKQIIENNEDPMTISGYPVSMMTIVGIVRNVELTSTKITYTVQDWSGSITGMLWLETGGNEHESSNVIENTYCRMTGTKRIQDSKTCMLVYNISPVEDMNEITFHYLQVIHIGLKVEEMRQNDVTQHGMTNMRISLDTNGTTNVSHVDDSALTDGLSLTPNQRMVYSVLKTTVEEKGIHINDLIQNIGGRISKSEIEKALQFLTDEGHAYNTKDDEHFKATDA